MISEIDIKDMMELDCTRAEAQIQNLVDYGHLEDTGYLYKFINAVEEFQRKHTKQIPALFKP